MYDARPPNGSLPAMIFSPGRASGRSGCAAGFLADTRTGPTYLSMPRSLGPREPQINRRQLSRRHPAAASSDLNCQIGVNRPGENRRNSSQAARDGDRRVAGSWSFRTGEVWSTGFVPQLKKEARHGISWPPSISVRGRALRGAQEETMPGVSGACVVAAHRISK